MGLFSSIKKGLSKAWKGVKKVVKKVARTVKKVAKKIAYATPIGKKLWDLSSKIGKGIMKGIGKITSKLGPVGTMALSFVLAPVMGPMLGNMWAGFGSGAASMAASANAFVSTLGSVGSGIFAAGNFVGGTLGALGSAITEGASNVLSGNFSAAAQSFASNVTSAFTGEAGMAAVRSGALAANASAAADLATQGGSAPQVNALSETAASNLEQLQGMGRVGTEAIAGMDPEVLARASNEAFAVQQNVQAQIEAAQMSSAGVTLDNPMARLERFQAGPTSPMETGATPSFGKSLELTTNAMRNTGVTDSGIMRNTLAQLQDNNVTFQSRPTESVSSNTLDKVQSLLGGGGNSGVFEPFVPTIHKSKPITSASPSQGQGSAGFSLLGGVEGLEESLRRSQQLMFS